MWAIGKWAGSVLLDYAVGALHGPKKEQKLDPVATICMLAFGALEELDNAKPSVNGHRFYFDKPGVLQGATRTYHIASHDDVGRLVSCIKLFIKHWEPKPESELYFIVTIALKGLENIAKTYHNEYATVDTTLDAYKDYLTRWQKEAWREPLSVTCEERELITKIKGIWDDAQLKLVWQFLQSSSVLQLQLLLDERDQHYQKIVQPDLAVLATSSRTLIPSAAAAGGPVRDETT